jgi:hypothetical protein
MNPTSPTNMLPTRQQALSMTWQRLPDDADAGLVLCDAQARVLLANDAARQELAGAQVVSLRDDGTLGVRSHSLGLLALRSAVRQAVQGGSRQAVTLRHGTRGLTVDVRPLDCGDDSDDAAWPYALLVLGGCRPNVPQVTDLLISPPDSIHPPARDSMTRNIARTAGWSAAGARP